MGFFALFRAWEAKIPRKFVKTVTYLTFFDCFHGVFPRISGLKTGKKEAFFSAFRPEKTTFPLRFGAVKKVEKSK